MAITISNALELSICDSIVDAVDAGAGAGTLEIQTAGDVEVATLTFGDPAFGAAAGNPAVATANSITSDTSATGGTAAKFVVKDSDSNTVWSGSVTATGGGGDIEIDSVTISAGATVSASSFTFQVGS